VIALAGAAALGVAAAAPAADAKPSQTKWYHSRKDLRPPKVTVTHPASGTYSGYIVSAPRPPSDNVRMGPLLFDDQGRVVFFHPLRRGATAVDFQVQRYQGRPVLTWSQRPTIHGVNIFAGQPSQEFDVIVDQHYHRIKTLRALGAGVHTQLHEFLLTPRGNAIVVGYRFLKRDARAVGGSKDQTVIDQIVQVVRVKNNKVLFNWHSINHVPLTDSVFKATPGKTFDYFHLNSVHVTPDHNLIISGRHVSAAYKVSLKTGKVIWRLGGKHSDWKLSNDARFAFQHDVVLRKGAKVSMFDNHAAAFNGTGARGLLLQLDTRSHTATKIASFAPSTPREAPSQGDVEHLGNGDWLVGWGVSPFASEYGPGGDLKWAATLPSMSFQSYRTFRWHGYPGRPPALVASRDAGGTVTAFASWNGSTEVRSWVLMGGSRSGHLHKVGEAAWDHFETKLKAKASDPLVRVLALDADRKVIGVSPVVRPTTG
jgi:hypothetical protein